MVRPLLAGLLVWVTVACAQRPSVADAAALVEKARASALSYTASLPDFLCTESIRRYAFVYSARQLKWLPKDRLTVKLSFFQQKEDHKLLTIDGKPTDKEYLSLEGATGAGEFGGTMLSIFDPAAQAAFHWQSWKSVRGHRAALYTYTVDAAHSRYLLVSGAKEHPEKDFVAFHGELEIDETTADVLHFTYIADHLPPALKIDKVATTVDYDFADVNGRRYLLPAHSDTAVSGSMSVRNEIEFREYRKFSAESTVDYGPGK